MKTRAQLFRYRGLVTTDDTLTGLYELDGRSFEERITFEGITTLRQPGVEAVAQLWYLLAGLSYYKAGAAHAIDLGSTPVGTRGRALFDAALRDGLAEFSFRNELPLDDVTITGGRRATLHRVALDPSRVLTPFGGGIDSVVTVSTLSPHVEQSLFIVSPEGGRFEALERTAAVTRLDVVRATRRLDPQVLDGDPAFFVGHVPVTAMISLLAAAAAIASGRGGVVMSNEQSASVANLRWRGSEVNHQWSKSLAAEELIGDAIDELVGSELVVASFLRDRSELWVAQRFSELTSYHDVFRSCNRAFAQDSERRALEWCGVCDKCLFIDLILAPFVERGRLRSMLGCEPLSDPRRLEQLRTLVGLGDEHKPFECVGDPDESAVALARIAESEQWKGEANIEALDALVTTTSSFEQLLTAKGPTRVPPHWSE